MSLTLCGELTLTARSTVINAKLKVPKLVRNESATARNMKN